MRSCKRCGEPTMRRHNALYCASCADDAAYEVRRKSREKHREKELAQRRLRYAMDPAERERQRKNNANPQHRARKALYARLYRERRGGVGRTGSLPSLAIVSQERNMVVYDALPYCVLPANMQPSELATVANRIRRNWHWGRTGGRCWYCGEPFAAERRMELDHVVSAISGGGNDDTNLVPACRGCNRSKNDRTVEQFRASEQRRRNVRDYQFAYEIHGWR